MPAQAGIQSRGLDSRFRGSDGADAYMARPGQARTSEPVEACLASFDVRRRCARRSGRPRSPVKRRVLVFSEAAAA